MKRLFDTYWKTGLFMMVGAGLGFAYWRFVGCSSGTCPLTANWHTSTLMGGLIGFLAVPSRKKTADNPATGNHTRDNNAGINNSAGDQISGKGKVPGKS